MTRPIRDLLIAAIHEHANDTVVGVHLHWPEVEPLCEWEADNILATPSGLDIVADWGYGDGFKAGSAIADKTLADFRAREAVLEGIVSRASRMGPCSQMHHEYVQQEARAALAPQEPGQ